jgi:ribonuclease-3
MKPFKKIFGARNVEIDAALGAHIKKIIGYYPKDGRYYQRAFTHKSMGLKDSNGNPLSYERLEFLGDAILGSIISEYIFNEVPHGDEGYLTKMRSKIVSREHLNELGQDFDLISFAQTQVPERNFGANVHGNLFEALVGALYLDRGYKATQSFIKNKVIKPYVDIPQLEGKVISYKSLLIEWCQKHKKTFHYNTYDDTGVNEVRHFSVKLSIDNRIVSKARATSKKKAEEKASKRAYFVFQDQMKTS